MKRFGYSQATCRRLWTAISKEEPSSRRQSAGFLRSVHQVSTGEFSGNASHRCLSTTPTCGDDTPASSSSKHIYVWEQTISSATAGSTSSCKKGNSTKEKMFSTKGRALYRSTIDNGSNGWELMPRTKVKADGNTNDSNTLSALPYLMNAYKSTGTGDLTNIQNIPFIHHFLPARYPQSVCPSYGSYASYCFLGNVAGSSAMVLSTQALLVAVGVGTQSAAPMAAALNWVMKDGVGQLGGVIFASQLGKGGIDFESVRSKIAKLTGSLNKDTTSTSQQTKKKRGNFQRGTADTNPKRWRMVAALALDLSTLLEICTPMMGPEWFLPCASIANIGKNVGFLAASASRAAIHQSLSMGGSSSPSMIPVPDGSDLQDEKEESMSKKSATASTVSNLGDVTAKSGSQAIVASLAGTAIGIFLSRTFCSDYGTAGILAGFVVLSAIHQVCTYNAVKVVPLRSLDRHRLHIVLTAYITDNFCNFGTETDSKNWMALTPAQVAEKETFLPLMPPDDSVQWLSVGASLTDICPLGVTELQGLLLPMKDEQRYTTDMTSAFDTKQHEKYILKVHPGREGNDLVQLTFMEGATDEDLLRGMFHAYFAHEYMKSNPAGSGTTQILLDTHACMSNQMPIFKDRLQEAGWEIGNGYINVECGSSYRLNIQSS